MAVERSRTSVSRFASDYGMLGALVLLCAFFCYATWDEQFPNDAAAGRDLARRIVDERGAAARVLIVVRDHPHDAEFAAALREGLAGAGADLVRTVKGEPADVRAALEDIAAAGGKLDAIAANHVTAAWAVLGGLDAKFPDLGSPKVVCPKSYRWPNFLRTDNLLNVANQIVVIAILAIGMTMVIITGGIDLSVGSLIALSAVVATLLIRELAGAEQAGAAGMVLCCLAGIAVCAMLGAFSGTMVTFFRIPPFIATLAMMLVASGLAYLLARGESIYQVPPAFTWLGRGTLLGRLPNAVVLMAILYAGAHVMMTRTTLGRYVYAVGGNLEAARLSGVRVKAVLMFAYTLCGALAGLGGIIVASQLKSGSPTYGQMYELHTIAAVVIGGTSLSGGEGKILGTLIGAFIMAVIWNGMNLTGVESYTQKVVLGLVILGAMLLDMLKKADWKFLRPVAR